MLHPFPHEPRGGTPLVEFRGVTCGYGGTPVLLDVSTSIWDGEFVGLLGPSGAGKTTFLRAILGAVEFYRGQVLVEGRPHDRGRRTAGYVPQVETVDWNFPVTVEQVVLMGFASQGGTVLLSSHLLHEIEVIADDLVVIAGLQLVGTVVA